MKLTTHTRPTARLSLALLSAATLLAGCAKPAPPPVVLERPPATKEITGTLAGTMYLVAGQVDLSAERITREVSLREGMAVPTREFTAWLVTMNNRSTRVILMNPQYDEWNVTTVRGATAKATPATRLRMRWFMDSLSTEAVERISYPSRVPKGETVRFPIYVPITGDYDLASMRFFNRDVEDEVDLVDPGLLPVPLPLASPARIESLDGEAFVVVGQDDVRTRLRAGGALRTGDVVELSEGARMVVFDEWGSGASYEITGPDTFRAVAPEVSP